MMGFIFNLIKRLIKTIIKLSIYLAIFITIIVLIPNLPPYTKFTSIKVSPIQPRVGPLALNGALNNAGKSFDGKLSGPEAFQVFKGELYTSLSTGEIVKVSPGGHVTFVTKLGQPCSGLTQEHICGRPLGFEIDNKDGSLYVADAYYGIWKVDLKTDKKQLLVSPRVEIEKRQPKLFNSIALAKNGDLYWTDSSSDFHLKDGAISIMCDPSGRLFHYDAAKNKSKVLLDDLWFANGVVLSPNNDFVVVSESFRSRLTKYYTAGPKKGKSEVFVDGLIGVPDNMRALPDGSGILVGLYTVFDEELPAITHSLAAAPVIRKFLARLQRMIEMPFERLNAIYPHIVFEEIAYYVGHFKSISGLTSPMAGLMVVDWDGNVVDSYYNTDGTLGHISDAVIYNDKLYTGSPHQEFIGTVPAPPLLKKAFESLKKSESEKLETKPQQAKPVQQAPKQKTEEKPKPKVEEKPKPKVEEKPKVETQPKVASKQTEEKKEKPKVVKPSVTETKPAQQAKPTKSAEPAKPAESAKPAKSAEQAKSAKAADAATQPHKPTTPQQAPTTPPPPKPTPAAAKPVPTKAPPAPKPEVKTTPPPKTAEKSTPPPKATPKVAETKTEAPKKAQPPVKTAEVKPKPIKEEIPSDTAKPPKETLKVIKKDGPTEIPVPNQ